MYDYNQYDPETEKVFTPEQIHVQRLFGAAVMGAAVETQRVYHDLRDMGLLEAKGIKLHDTTIGKDQFSWLFQYGIFDPKAMGLTEEEAKFFAYWIGSEVHRSSASCR